MGSAGWTGSGHVRFPTGNWSTKENVRLLTQFQIKWFVEHLPYLAEDQAEQVKNFLFMYVEKNDVLGLPAVFDR